VKQRHGVSSFGSHSILWSTVSYTTASAQSTMRHRSAPRILDASVVPLRVDALTIVPSRSRNGRYAILCRVPAIVQSCREAKGLLRFVTWSGRGSSIGRPTGRSTCKPVGGRARKRGSASVPSDAGVGMCADWPQGRDAGILLIRARYSYGRELYAKFRSCDRKRTL